MSEHVIWIGEVGRSHPCNADSCRRKLIVGEDRLETQLHRYCLPCGYKHAKKMIKHWQDDLKEIERTHLKKLVAERIMGV